MFSAPLSLCALLKGRAVSVCTLVDKTLAISKPQWKQIGSEALAFDLWESGGFLYTFQSSLGYASFFFFGKHILKHCVNYPRTFGLANLWLLQIQGWCHEQSRSITVRNKSCPYFIL